MVVETKRKRHGAWKLSRNTYDGTFNEGTGEIVDVDVLGRSERKR